MSNATKDTVELTTLFDSTTYQIIYAAPLLMLSIVLTFAGAFLTLDRTRNFAPRFDAEDPISTLNALPVSSKRSRFAWVFEGGVGGSVGGFIFGVHASTFLALLIMNESSSTPLGSMTFLVVWCLSAIACAIVAARFLIATLIFMGISGGASMGLSFCIILHPSLMTRVALCGVMTVLALILILIPSPKTRHVSLRLCAASAGAFTFCLSAALLSHTSSWANAWERLWVSNSSQWGTTAERGFDAGFAFLFVIGALSDWALRRRFGSDPDEKWDSYLAQYTNSLPYAHDRAGHFQPIKSFWARVTSYFHKDDYSFPEILFPTDKPMYAHEISSLNNSPPSGEKYGREVSPPHLPVFDNQMQAYQPSSPTFMRNVPKRPKKKGGLHFGRKRRDPVQFRPVDGFSSSSDSSNGEQDDDVLKTPSSGHPLRRPKVVGRKSSLASNLSGTTLQHSHAHISNADLETWDNMDVEKEKAKISELRTQLGRGGRVDSSSPSSRASPGSPVEYSDIEEQDVSVVLNDIVYDSDRERERMVPGWKPGFLKAPGVAPSPPPGAVPMTHSLIRALDRITQAQESVYGSHQRQPQAHISSQHLRSSPVTADSKQAPNSASLDPEYAAAGQDEEHEHGWEGFWQDVRSKAAEYVSKGEHV